MVEFKQILCPVDLSELSLRPLAYAAAFAALEARAHADQEAVQGA